MCPVSVRLPNHVELGLIAQLRSGPWLYFDCSIVPARLDPLTIDTRWPKNPPDDALVEHECGGRDERGNLRIHSPGEISK